MKEAQQRRWAKIRGASEPPAPATPEALKPKRKLSAAGRKAIQDALRRRWAQKRAEGAKAQPANAKNTARKKAAAKKAAVKALPAKADKRVTKRPGTTTVSAVAQPAG
jgi:hypothetical protein